MPATRASELPLRLLITAGPTHEPIDSVRFIGNRSSGKLGIAIAEASARRKTRGGRPNVDPNLKPESQRAAWQVTLALGPTTLTPTTPAAPSPSDSPIRLLRFRTAADLQALLATEVPTCDILIMAAAVADYRPRIAPDAAHGGKIRRTDQTLTLELEPTPDLLAGIGASRRPDQLIVGFALEPESRLLESARSKLERKRIDLIVANPLETMDAPDIRATIVGRGGILFPPHPNTPARGQSKEDFAQSLLDLVEREYFARAHAASPPPGA